MLDRRRRGRRRDQLAVPAEPTTWSMVQPRRRSAPPDGAGGESWPASPSSASSSRCRSCGRTCPARPGRVTGRDSSRAAASRWRTWSRRTRPTRCLDVSLLDTSTEVGVHGQWTAAVTASSTDPTAQGWVYGTDLTLARDGVVVAVQDGPQVPQPQQSREWGGDYAVAPLPASGTTCPSGSRRATSTCTATVRRRWRPAPTTCSSRRPSGCSPTAARSTGAWGVAVTTVTVVADGEAVAPGPDRLRRTHGRPGDAGVPGEQPRAAGRWRCCRRCRRSVRLRARRPCDEHRHQPHRRDDRAPDGGDHARRRHRRRPRRARRRRAAGRPGRRRPRGLRRAHQCLRLHDDRVGEHAARQRRPAAARRVRGLGGDVVLRRRAHADPQRPAGTLVAGGPEPFTID